MPLYLRTILVTAADPQAVAASRDHLTHIAELRSQGRLRFAARFTRGDGFVEAFEADDLKHADKLARSSPLVREGLASWSVREVEVG